MAEIASRESSSISMKHPPDAKGAFEEATQHMRGSDGLLTQEGDMYNWSKIRGGPKCGMAFAFQLVMSGAIGSFLFGINLSLLNTCLNTIASEYQWCGSNHNIDCTAAMWYSAFMNTVVFIGAAVGSISSARFLILGRRMLMLLCQIVFTFGTVSSCVANSFSALVWARFVVGVGVGIMSVAPPAWMSEMSPTMKRGRYTVNHQFQLTVGIFIGVIIGLPLHSIADRPEGWILPMFDKVWWRVMLGLGMVPVIIGTYLNLFVHTFETPHWYAEQRRYRDCEEILKRIYEKDDVNAELQQVVESLQQAEEARKNGMSLCKAMSMPEYRRVILVGCLLSGFQQLGGVNIFIASSNRLFQLAGLSGIMITVCSAIITLLNSVMTIPTMFLIERYGRRTLLLVGTFFQTAFVTPAMVSYWTEADPEKPGKVTQILAIIGVVGFIVFFALAYGPVLWVYLFEIYTPDVKDVAASLAAMMNWVCAIIMVFCGSLIPNRIAYTVFTVMCGISVVIVFLTMKETKGRPLGDSPFFTKKNELA